MAILVLFYYGLLALSTVSLYLARTYKNGVGRLVYIVNRDETHL